MSANRFLTILGKIVNSYAFRLVAITAGMLLLLFCMLESKDASVPFIYNNF